jgi:hypothetical protein
MPKIFDYDQAITAKIKKDRAGCWLWIGALDKDGYGISDWGHTHRGTNRAHRVVYMEKHGPLLPGIDLDHICRVRRCVNPAHLRPIGNTENARLTKGHRLLATHCKNGHEFTPENTFRLERRGGVERICRACNRKRQAARRVRIPDVVRAYARSRKALRRSRRKSAP